MKQGVLEIKGTSNMDTIKLKRIVEGALLAADQPLSVEQLEKLFVEGEERPTRDELREALKALEGECEDRGYELQQVASGFRFQVRQEYAHWVGRLWEEKPPRYSRATLETLALIAYRQPITRAEIEEIRGVSVSTNIVKSLTERDWIRVVGHKDVPGKPAMYGTTRGFLDYFNLKSLDDLPTLAELRDLDKLHPELGLDNPDMPQERSAEAANYAAGEIDIAAEADADTGTAIDSPPEADTGMESAVAGDGESDVASGASTDEASMSEDDALSTPSEMVEAFVDEDAGVDEAVDEAVDDELSNERQAPEDDEDEIPDSERSVH